jgi:hypothetical protein
MEQLKHFIKPTRDKWTHSKKLGELTHCANCGKKLKENQKDICSGDCYYALYPNG